MIRWMSIFTFLAVSLLYPLQTARAACMVIAPDTIMSDVGHDLKTIQELPFKDFGGRKGKAVLRNYWQSDDTPVSDVIFYRANGEIDKIDMPSSEWFESTATTIAFSPDHDSISLETMPVMNGVQDPGWEAVLDAATCEWIGFKVTPDYASGFPKIKFNNFSKPEFTKERAYLEKGKYYQMYFTPEMVEENRQNPEWAYRVWLLDNSNATYAGRADGGALKLQWYAWDDKKCAKEPKDIDYGPYRIKATDPIILCNTKKRQWTTLFEIIGYKDSIAEDLKLIGNVIDIKGYRSRATVDLKDFHWTHTQNTPP